MASEPSNSTQVRPAAHCIPPAALQQALTPTLQQLVESPQPSMQPSKLLTFPVELLDFIFKDVYATAPPRAPICRALLAYHDEQHRSRFRRVKVVGSVMLASYCRSLEIRSSIGAMCESFKAVAPRNGFMSYIAPADLALLLASLSNVRYLELEGYQLVEAFLKRGASLGPPFMPHLGDLVLRDMGGCNLDPYDPNLLRGLGTFAHLKKLRLDLAVAVSHGQLVEVEQQVPYACAALRELTLVDCLSSPGAVDFIQRCTQLEELNMRDKLEGVVDGPFLDAVGHLGTLKHLELSSTIAGYSWKLPKALKNLSSLDALILGAGCTVRDKPSFEVLRRIPITLVEFKVGSVVSASHLLKLIDGDDKHPHLESLVLDQVSASLGNVQDFEWRDEPDELGHWLSYGWRLPKWSATFSREGLEALIAAGASNGVDVSGKAVDALDLEWEIKNTKEQAKGWMEREARRNRRAAGLWGGGGGGRRWGRW
ncbi:hypothetical protein JCM8208_001129 [Rhodotorula glutinis]